MAQTQHTATDTSKRGTAAPVARMVLLVPVGLRWSLKERAVKEKTTLANVVVKILEAAQQREVA